MNMLRLHDILKEKLESIADKYLYQFFNKFTLKNALLISGGSRQDFWEGLHMREKEIAISCSGSLDPRLLLIYKIF